jgi:hypothetical protein
MFRTLQPPEKENATMGDPKYGKYIVTEFYDKFELPAERAWEKAIMGRGELDGKRRFMEHMVWMDSNVIPNAFYAEAVWFWPQATRPRIVQPEDAKNAPGIPPHTHPFPELLSYYGTDMDHPNELYCEVEFWIEDEKYVFDKSFVVYIPENVVHCPLKMHHMKQPIFHFTMGPGLNYE